MQLFNQKTQFLNSFIRFFESKTLKTLILDTFASENVIQLLLFAFLDFAIAYRYSFCTSQSHQSNVAEATRWGVGYELVQRSATRWVELLPLICRHLQILHHNILLLITCRQHCRRSDLPRSRWESRDHRGTDSHPREKASWQRQAEFWQLGAERQW